MFGETRFGNTGRGEGHTGAAASLALARVIGPQRGKEGAFLQ